MPYIYYDTDITWGIVRRPDDFLFIKVTQEEIEELTYRTIGLNDLQAQTVLYFDNGKLVERENILFNRLNKAK